jgi:transposase
VVNNPKGRPMKKLVRPVRKVNADVVGLDVHQRQITFTRLDRHGEDVEMGQVKCSEEEVLALLGRLPRPLHVAFEAGGSTFWLYDVLVACLGEGFVHVAQPKKIRAIANSTQKNDSNDSWWLAYLTYEGRLPECHVPTGALRELRIAVRERFECVKLITRAKVRLRSHLRQMGVTLPTRKLDSISGWNALIDLTEEREGIQARAVAHYLTLLEYQFSALEEWEQMVEDLATGLPEVETLRREMPGVGPVLSAVLVAELGPIQRFKSPKAMARYTGLTPSDRSTDGKHRPGAITREGSEHLRWALTQAAMGCLRSRSGPGLAAGNWIRVKERRMGCKAKARAAGARKLAESIWRLFHWGERFDAAKPFGGLPAVAR